MHKSWQEFFELESRKTYFKELSSFIKNEYSTKIIYPPQNQIYSAFATDLAKIKVVIIGQDPYHEPDQAHGLAFSVNENQKIPPSLRNIFEEIKAEFNTPKPANGNLERWAEQGVLLLNNVLTVEAHLAGSHKGKGWEIFTENVVKYLNNKHEHLVFLLWGRDAKAKAKLIDHTKHLILESAHPSPLSARRGFFGSNHFKKCNEQLEAWKYQKINW